MSVRCQAWGGGPGVSACSISELLGLDAHSSRSPEELNSSWLRSHSLIHSAGLSLQGRRSSVHKPVVPEHLPWDQQRIISDHTLPYLALRPKYHSLIHWFIYSFDKYVFNVNHILGPMIGSGALVVNNTWSCHQEASSLWAEESSFRAGWEGGRVGLPPPEPEFPVLPEPPHTRCDSGHAFRSFVYILDASTRVPCPFPLLSSFQVQLYTFSITQASRFPGSMEWKSVARQPFGRRLEFWGSFLCFITFPILTCIPFRVSGMGSFSSFLWSKKESTFWKPKVSS